MPGWLDRILRLAERAVPNAVLDIIGLGLGGLVSVLGGLTGNVSDAWRELAIALDALRAGHFNLLEALEGILGQVIGHWIPKYAITAWWWVTHPAALAEQLGLYLVAWLEREAWTIAPYLGKFLLALLVHNIPRVAKLAEDVIAAVL